MGEGFKDGQTRAAGSEGEQPSAASPETVSVDEASPEEYPVSRKQNKRKRRTAVLAACATMIAALAIWWIVRPAPGPVRFTKVVWVFGA